jgi:hypothetical protein
LTLNKSDVGYIDIKIDMMWCDRCDVDYLGNITITNFGEVD